MTTDADACPKVFVGIDGEDKALLSGADLKERYTADDEWDDNYAGAVTHTPVFSHLAYGALLLVLMGLNVRAVLRGDRRPGAIIVLAMGASAFLFTASFFIISNACDYRYLYLLDVTSVAALLRQVSARGGTPIATRGNAAAV
jgi:hypothetical protein